MKRILAAGWAAIALLAQAQARVPWRPVTAADFAITAPASEPEAPAVAVRWDIEVDDTDDQRWREVTEYTRYRIFDPERSMALTRLSEIGASGDNGEIQSSDLRARVTHADGSSAEFGPDAVQERTLRQSAESAFARFFTGDNEAVTERFLAVGGLQRGDVLDLQVKRRTHANFTRFAHPLQKPVPVMAVRLKQFLPNQSDFFSRSFLINGALGDAKIDHSKSSIIEVTASNLPSLIDEPASPPPWDRGAFIFTEHVPTHSVRRSTHVDLKLRVSPSDGQWAPTANLEFLAVEDGAFVTGDVVSVARHIAEGASTAKEQAERVHQYVQRLYQRFVHGGAAGRPVFYNLDRNEPLTHVMEFERYPKEVILPADFIHLEIALDRALRLQAVEELMPDKRQRRFEPTLVAEMFLPNRLVRVNADGQWYDSDPLALPPRPFGALGWFLEGQPALLVQRGKQQWVDKPALPASATMIRSVADFELAADGTLTGSGSQVFSGHRAPPRRGALINRVPTRRLVFEARRLREMLGGDAEVVVTGIDGVENLAEPVTVHYTVRIPGYATVTGRRIIFKPSVLHANVPPPFGAAKRQNDIMFPYRWQDIDDISIRYPQGFKLEEPSAPAGFGGDLLSFKIAMSDDTAAHTIHLMRQFESNVGYLPARAYGAMKVRYDVAGRGDAHELILVRTP